MRILADLHIAPRTVAWLRSLGHNVARVNEILPPDAGDLQILEVAAREERTILTQDLDFSDLIALSGRTRPSLITLRLNSSRIEQVNTLLEKLLPTLEVEVEHGVLVTVRDVNVRRRFLPVGRE